MKGWVYIITNPSIPNVLKVGCSKNDPKLRAQQFNTGAPDDYVVEYDALVDNFNKIEKESHLLLNDYDKKKEWFKCDIYIAVLAIRQAANYSVMHEFFREKEEIELEIELDELIAWADENSIVDYYEYYDIFGEHDSSAGLPRDKEKALQITELNLPCGLEDIHPAIGKLINLKVLCLAYNDLSDLPKTLSQLTNLTRLFLFRNEFTHLPEVIAKLPNLIDIELSNNKITQIPEWIDKLRNVTNLSFSKNKLIQLPKSIGNLANLETLYLDSNQISFLPEEIGDIVNLKHLNLLNNKISSLPLSLGKLTKLEILDLRDNPIKNLPPELSHLRHITKFN